MTMMLWENPSLGASSAQLCLSGRLQEAASGVEWDPLINKGSVE